MDSQKSLGDGRSGVGGGSVCNSKLGCCQAEERSEDSTDLHLGERGGRECRKFFVVVGERFEWYATRYSSLEGTRLRQVDLNRS